MNIKYILYIAVIIVALAFILLLLYMFITSMKKKIVNKRIDKFSIRSGNRVTHKELDKILKYIEKNKKYLTPSAYKIGMYKIDKARLRM
jgi:ABC-type glycerol-3-phosphate transport system permease component